MDFCYNLSNNVASVLSLNMGLLPFPIKVVVKIILLLYAITQIDPVVGHTLNTDPLYYFQAYLPNGCKCGKQTLTGWEVTYDRYRKTTAEGGGLEDGKYMDSTTGIWTAPRKGVYHCCAHARCRAQGVCDFTIVKNDDLVRAAFGTRTTLPYHNGWSSQGICYVDRMQVGRTLRVVQNDAGSNDCTQETGWKYCQFSCSYISEF